MKEIVLVLGCNAAGKTSHAQKYINDGYVRINRDEIGGRLLDIHKHADQAIQDGADRLVLDNTFRDPASRQGIIEVAKKHGYSIRAEWLDTDKYQSMGNAVLRMVRKYGKLLEADEIKAAKDPNTFPVQAIYSFYADVSKGGFVEPSQKEGFDRVDRIKFKWSFDTNIYKNSALILDFDDTVRHIVDPSCKTKFPTKKEHIGILPGRKEKLAKAKDEYDYLLGASNQSGIAKGDATREAIVECFDHTCDLVGVKIETMFCPHKVPPISCYCRKPNPGMLMYWIETKKLNPAKVLFVGDQTSDKNCAKNAGVNYMDQADFFR